MKLKDFIKIFEKTPHAITENTELQERIFQALGHKNKLRDYVLELENIIENQAKEIPIIIDNYIRSLEKEYGIAIRDIETEKQLTMERRIENKNWDTGNEYITVQTMYVPGAMFMYVVSRPKEKNEDE